MPSAGPARRAALALALAAPLALATAAYARVLDGELLLDDVASIERNPAARDPAAAARALPGGALGGGGRPLADLTYALDRAAWGPGRRGLHATSVALHLGVSALAFLLARRALRLAGAARPDGTAAAAAALFALHPLQTEAASYLAQRAEVLASGLAIAALLLLLEADGRGRTRAGAAAALGATVALGLALAAKAIAVVTPAAWLLAVLVLPAPAARARPAPWRWRAVVLAPATALAAIHAWRTLAATAGHSDVGASVPGLPPLAYLATQLRVVPTYLRLLAWPAGQSADWDFPASPGLGDPAALAGGLLLAALAGVAVLVAVRAGRREGPGAAAARVAAFGFLWFLLWLAPTSSVVPLADVLVEHRAYLASLGIFAGACAVAERLVAWAAPRRAGLAGAALAAIVCAALAGATHRRNAVWESRLAFWSDAARTSPGKARVHLGLGEALAARGDLGGALAEYERALARAGENRAYRALILRNVAGAHAQAGRLDAAADAYARSLERDPTDGGALAGLAIVEARRGRPDAAEEAARRALAAAPEQPEALAVLGGLRLERGDADGAATLFERAARADPDAGVYLVSLGVARLSAGRAAEGCGALEAATRLRLDARQRALAERTAAAAGCR